MSVDGSVSGGSGEVLALSVRDVLSVSLNVSFGESKVQNENFVGSFIQSDTKVIWLDVSVNEISVVNILNSLDHLIDQNKDCLQREFSESLVEK